jgi:HK97 family phage prohead protease
MTAQTTTSPSDSRALADFRRAFGTLGETERRTFPLANGRVKNTGTGDGRLKVIGHAAVFNSPSVELSSRAGTFTEYIAPGAFDAVLRSEPDVLLLWDHNTLYPLARTTADTLELTVNAHGLRYYATVTPTSYADDLRSLMNDGIVNASSFTFTVAPDGEEWAVEGERVVRTIRQVGELFDVCVTCAGAYPAADAAAVRSLALAYALDHHLIDRRAEGCLRAAQMRAELQLRRRKLEV